MEHTDIQNAVFCATRHQELALMSIIYNLLQGT